MAAEYTGRYKQKLRDLDLGVKAGILAAGAFYIERVKRTFQLFAPRGHATGTLIRSLGVSKVVFVSGYYRARAGAGVVYSWYVHEGTGPKAGHGPRKPPPVDAILGWVKEKGIVPRYTVHGGKKKRRKAVDVEREMRSVAFLIARKIGREGTAPFPFLASTLRAYREDMKNIIIAHAVRALRS